jgi:hypothetical protein
MEDLGDFAWRRWEMRAWCWRGVRGLDLVGEGVRKAEEEVCFVGVENMADANSDQHWNGVCCFCGVCVVC